MPVRVAACVKRSFRLVWSGAADPRGCRKATIHYRTGMDRVDRVCGDSEAQHEVKKVRCWEDLGSWETFAATEI